MRPATLLGWLFPDVPETARLVYARATSAMPGAGGVSLLNGGALGGTSYILDFGALGIGEDYRAQLIAVGFGLVAIETSYTNTTPVAPGGQLLLPTAYGFPGQALPFSSLELLASATGLYYNAQGMGDGPRLDVPFLLRDGVISPADFIHNAAAGVVDAYTEVICHNRDQVSLVTFALGRQKIEAGGTLVGAPVYPQGGIVPDWGQVLLAGGDATPALFPVQGPPKSSRFGAGEALIGKVTEAAGCRIIADGQAVALCAVAVWPVSAEA